MQDARKFACNALFGECNANADEFYFDVLLLHARKCRRSRFYKNAAMMRNAATTANALKFA